MTGGATSPRENAAARTLVAFAPGSAPADQGQALMRVTRLLADAGVFMEVTPVHRLDGILSADGTARALVLYPGPMASLVAAMGRGVDPVTAATAWAGEARAILRRVREFAPQCLPVSLGAAAHGHELAGFLFDRWGIDARDEPATPVQAAADPVTEALAALALGAGEAREAADALARHGPGDAPPEGDPSRAFEALRALRLARLSAGEEVLGAQGLVGRPAILFAHTPAVETIHTDDDFEHPAFYPPERLADGTPLRFMGREETAFLRTRVPYDGPLRVSVIMPAAASVPAFEAFRVTLNGENAAFVETVADGTFAEGGVRHVSTFRGPDTALRDAAGVPDTVSLTLHAPVRVEDLERRGGPRLLSVGVRAIEIARLSEADLADLSAAPDDRLKILFDETFAHPAFHEAERRDGAVFRWMGRANEARLATRLRRTRPVTVTLFVPLVADRACLEGLTLMLDEEPAALTHERAYGVCGAVLSARFCARAEKVQPPSSLTLKVDAGARPPPPIEGRTLLVAFEKIVMALDETDDR